MKKLFSTILTTIFILSSFSFTTINAFASDEVIEVQVTSFSNVLSNGGTESASKIQLLEGDSAPDGITALKVNPDACEDRDPTSSTECYVLLQSKSKSLGITPATYKYARLTYLYVPADKDTNEYSPYIRFNTTGTGYMSYTSNENLIANKWSVLDIEISGTDYAADEVIDRIRVYAFGEALGTLDYNGGSYDPTKVTVANPDSTLYIANLAFFKDKPGVPTVTGISFASSEIEVARGESVKIPNITIYGENSPNTSYDLILSGHTSVDTKISDDAKYIYVGDDEESNVITLTATSVADSSIYDTLTVNITDYISGSSFDADNVVLSFGVVSDIHLAAIKSQEARSKAKWAHVIDIFQNLGADAILMNGDLTDAISSPGNVRGAGLHTDKDDAYGTKAEQNFRETSNVAQGMWGESDGGYGNGTNSSVRMFYSLGNHDEGGKGYTAASTENSFSEVYSADYMAAVICGWQYNPNSEAALEAPDGMEDSYRSYIADLLDYNNNPETTTVTASSFEYSYGVTLASADAKFDKFFGFDSDFSLKNEHGLRYGNRHMTIDPDGENDDDFSDDIHFIAIELIQSEESITWAEKIIQKSISENPNKPIFIITHYKPTGTTLIGSQYRNITRLGELLSNYPQTFVWGGHNHTFLHSDRAIDTTNGYVATDSAGVSYASMYNLTNGDGFGATKDTSKLAVNANVKENRAFGNGAFVQVDKYFNVRINRVDLYRSFSADYAENPTLFSVEEFTDFSNMASFQPVDEVVYIRTPWDITDIGPEGTHLRNYTKERFEMSGVPTFADNSSLSVVGGEESSISVKFTMDAEDDGMVYMYLLELTEKDTTDVLQRYYFTNKFYDYPNANIPVIEAEHTFYELSPDTTYTVHLTPVDDFMNRGVALTADATTLNAETKVTITLDANGGTCAFAEANAFEGETIILPTASKENAVFIGWAESADSTEGFIQYKANESKTLYALFVECNTQVIYIDPKSEINGDGKSVYSPIKVFDANAIALSENVNTTYVFMNSTCIDEFQDSAGASTIFTCVDPILETKYDSYVYYLGSNMGSPILSRILTLDIPFVHAKAGATYVSINTRGYKTTIGKNYFEPEDGSIIPGTDIVCTSAVDQIRGGGDNENPITTNLIFETIDNVTAKIKAGSMKGNVIGNTSVTIYNGSKKNQTIELGNDQNDSNTIGGNAVLKVYNYSKKDATITANATIDSISGAVYYILLNNAADYITIADNASAKAEKGGYIIKSYGDGDVSVEGDKLYIHSNTGEIYINGVIQEISEDDSYELGDAGTYVITYYDSTPKHNIVYKANGGEGEDVTKAVKEGDSIDLMSDVASFTKEYYTFVGWNTDANATTALESLVMGTSDVTLYAIWKVKVCNVTLIIDGIERPSGFKPNSESLAVITFINNGEIIATVTEDANNTDATITANIKLNAGEYEVIIEKNGYVSTTVSARVDNDSIFFQDFTLIAGDIKETFDAVCGDGIVDIDDYIRVLRGFNTSIDPKVKLCVDINEDGEVNVTDLGYIKANFKK